MESKSTVALVWIVVILLGFWLWWNLRGPALPPVDLAQCLARGYTAMYGSASCPHCQNQKRMFGNAWRYIPYVECPRNKELCDAKNVQQFPTWIFRDGTRITGETTLNKLAQQSGCEFPK